MGVPAPISSALSGWLESGFPAFPHHGLGVSGAALLYEAFRHESRGTVILPAFTSYTLSGAATAAGKRVVHIDADPSTLHMRADLLDQAIIAAGADDVMVLVDHTCGHPFPGLEALRRRHPGVLIVEDCVRALGGEAEGAAVGSRGDWTLLSLYKTAPGNLDGAILLSRTPLEVPCWEPAPVVLKQRVAGFKVARRLHHRLRRGPYSEPDRDRGTLKWSPRTEAPNQPCLGRFERWVSGLGRLCESQQRAAAAIREALSELTWIDPAPNCTSAAHYLSFTVGSPDARNRLLETMHRRGCDLERTWHVVPSFYRGFAETFPYGSAGSEFLADHIIHIPMADYVEVSRRERLIEGLRAEVHAIPSSGN